MYVCLYVCYICLFMCIYGVRFENKLLIHKMLHTFRAAWEKGTIYCAAKYAAEFRRIVLLRITIDNNAALIIIDWHFLQVFFAGFHTYASLN